MNKTDQILEDNFDVFVPPILECRLLIRELEKERRSGKGKVNSAREQKRGYSLRIF